jgi:hypothetical protein
MKQRCYNENHSSYKRYGGRGITVCDEWKNDFVEFRNWAINNGYKDGLTLDRINNNGDYEPSNCRWATLLEQANNKSNNRYITYDGETKTYSEWCRIKNYNRHLIQERINMYHWSEKDALLIKPRGRRLSNKWED